MTVYVDGANIRADVGNIRGVWCHMTADTKEELIEFARGIGLKAAWFQTCKHSRACRPPENCVHWHFDVTKSKRAAAVAAGAVEIDRHQMVALLTARREAMRAAAAAAAAGGESG